MIDIIFFFISLRYLLTWMMMIGRFGGGEVNEEEEEGLAGDYFSSGVHVSF